MNLVITHKKINRHVMVGVWIQEKGKTASVTNKLQRRLCLFVPTLNHNYFVLKSFTKGIYKGR